MSTRNYRGQSTLEYVILVGFVVAALIAMGFYMKRGFEGRLKQSTDQIGEQYSAENSTSNYTTVSNLTQSETVNAGVTNTQITQNTQVKTGSENVSALSNQ